MTAGLATLSVLTACQGTSGTERPRADAGHASPASAPTGRVVPPAVADLTPCPDARDRAFSSRRSGYHFSGYVRGSGTTVAILLHQSRGTPCDLAGLMGRLADEGMRVVSWTADPGTTPAALALLVAQERGSGARRVVLVGASAGGATSLVAAGQIRPAVDAVVALSPSGIDSETGDVVRAVAAYPGPMMAVAAENDPSFSAVPAVLAAAHTGRELTKIYPDSSDHGKDFVMRPDSPVADDVVRFLAVLRR